IGANVEHALGNDAAREITEALGAAGRIRDSSAGTLDHHLVAILDDERDRTNAAEDGIAVGVGSHHSTRSVIVIDDGALGVGRGTEPRRARASGWACRGVSTSRESSNNDECGDYSVKQHR